MLYQEKSRPPFPECKKKTFCLPWITLKCAKRSIKYKDNATPINWNYEAGRHVFSAKYRVFLVDGVKGSR